jgi:hypothetical protein
MAANRPAYIDHVERFNHTLKVVTRDLALRFPNDAVIFRAQRRVMTVIGVNPVFVIETAGPYLYKYRAQMYGNDEEFFLDNSYDTELKEDGVQERVDMVSYIIPKAKECARGLAPAEKEEYKQMIISLLDDYIEYIAAIKLGDGK